MRRIGPPIEQLPDEALVAGLRTGDPDISLAFVRRFQAKVYGTALAVLGDPRGAEDVAQQAFERAWRHAASYDPVRGSVTTWLGTITRRLAIDAARLHRPVPYDTDELLARVVTADRSPERAAVDGEAADQLRAALRDIPADQARAVVLAGIAGMSASQVADAERIPLGTAKTRIRTGMHRLRRHLDQQGVNPWPS